MASMDAFIDKRVVWSATVAMVDTASVMASILSLSALMRLEVSPVEVPMASMASKVARLASSAVFTKRDKSPLRLATWDAEPARASAD